MAICMVTPHLCQPASASAALNSDCSVGVAIESEMGMESITAEPADSGLAPINTDSPVPYAWTKGIRVLNITVYPLALDPNTGKTVYFTNVYGQISYSTIYYAQAGLYLSSNQTVNLMQRMLNALDSSSSYQNYLLAGWHIKAQIQFAYDKPEYILYRYKTSTAVSEDIKEDVRSTNFIYTFSKSFGYPTKDNIDPMKDYYYLSIEGAFYAKNSVGDSSGTLFGAVVGFNSSNPTVTN